MTQICEKIIDAYIINYRYIEPFRTSNKEYFHKNDTRTKFHVMLAVTFERNKFLYLIKLIKLLLIISEVFPDFTNISI